MNERRRSSRNSRGVSIIEASLMLPWVIFLFLAVVDFGFFGYALITIQNAVRAAAMYSSSNMAYTTDPAYYACSVVLGEVRTLPNLSSGGDCSACTSGSCQPFGDSRLIVTSNYPASGPDGDPAVSVSLTYTTIDMFPIPWLPGRFTFTRNSEMRTDR